MFIVNPNKGGFQGDVVNSGFRRGRQDAYRDYIDNFNFALKADAANNAENQLNVQRAANNYGLENQMRQGARTEAINFVNDASKLDNAVVGGEINFHKNNELWDQAKELGKAQGQEFIASQSAGTNKAINANTEQSYLADNPDLIQSATKAKYESPELINQARQAQTAHSQAATEGVVNNNTAVKNVQNAAGTYAETQKAYQEHEPNFNMALDGLNQVKGMTDDQWNQLVLDGLVQDAKSKGDTRSEADIANAIKNNTAEPFSQKVQAYKQAQLQQAEQVYSDALAERNRLGTALSNARTDLEASQLGASYSGKGRSTGRSQAQAKPVEPKIGNIKFDKKNERAFTDYITQSNGSFLNGDQSIGLVGSTVVYPSGRTVQYPQSYTKEMIMQAEGLDTSNTEEQNANSGNIMGN